MKSRYEIEKAIQRVDIEGTKFPAMTYEQGIEEALMWVLEEVSDEEFDYSP